MRRLILGVLFSFACGSQCFAYGSIACGAGRTDIHCFGITEQESLEDADAVTLSNCTPEMGGSCSIRARLDNDCVSLAYPMGPSKSSLILGRGSTSELANQLAVSSCRRSFNAYSCDIEITLCDRGVPPLSLQLQKQAQVQTTPQTSPRTARSVSDQAPLKDDHSFAFLRDPAFYQALVISKLFQDIWTGIGLGLGILIVILVYAKRAAITNFVIHGNLPFKLTNYADDIEVLFKRTQRVNWYGRVVFGIVARLGMTDDQLGLVRRYWLGRVIAFDGLRRQRQNKLAVMHLQLAARAKTESKDTKPLSQIWAGIKTLLLVVFYLFRALFSFLFGFLFIRVTIAKLVRGKLIESTDLVLILQAKEAIEQSAKYLKEYLGTAETFTGQEELFEPERSVDTVLAPLHRRGQT